ncbi:hypothetical protein EYF80_026403 [Liparis tanakae]|uniref:Uncharacterized protein n=1 Tax=Liparis tanakae TaxID=230148 RepID=A0A4Z2HCM9_9TELE|nr:hypothetical protein EYF80_026403 [Liparis tanakae]
MNGLFGSFGFPHRKDSQVQFPRWPLDVSSASTLPAAASRLPADSTPVFRMLRPNPCPDAVDVPVAAVFAPWTLLCDNQPAPKALNSPL